MDPLFWISFLVALAGTMILVTQKNAVYALLGLLIAFGATAGVFLSLDAPFVAVSQILIYAGALAVLFLFVLMLTDTRTEEDEHGLPHAIGARPDFDPRAIEEEYKGRESSARPLRNFLNAIVLPKPMAVVVSLAFLVCTTFVIWALPESYNSFGELPDAYDGVTFEPVDVEDTEDMTAAERVKEDPNLMKFGDTDAVSRTIFEGFPLAFEVVSLLIFTAVLGAILLARRHLAGTPSREGHD